MNKRYVWVMLTIGMIFVSLKLMANEPKPWCFYLNKDHTKKLCIASIEDMRNLRPGVSIKAELLVEENVNLRSKDSYGEIDFISQTIRFSKATLIPPEISSLPYSIYIKPGAYPQGAKNKYYVELYVEE